MRLLIQLRGLDGIAAHPEDRLDETLVIQREPAEVPWYFEIMGSRAIYHDGWIASATGPRLPWVAGAPPGIADWTPDQDEWRLYNLDEDWTQANDLAAQMPDKLAQMKETFAIEAARNSASPPARRRSRSRPSTPRSNRAAR